MQLQYYVIFLFFHNISLIKPDAAWAQAGFLAKEELLNIRKHTSDLEGHPTPRLPFVDVATGSLGQAKKKLFFTIKNKNF